MAPPHIAVALTAACLALVATFTAISTFGLPELDYWHWKPEIVSSWWTENDHQQILDHLPVPSWNPTAGTGDQYLVGAGKADITGPVVEINMMGYADPNQLGSGLRQRLYSRAFIIGSTDKPQDRFVYLVLDTQSGDTAVRHGILDSLRSMGPEYAVYGSQNVAVTGTHSHSGPGAWLNYLLPQITSRGFSKQSYEAIVQGAVASIKRAHDSLTPGRLNFGTVRVDDANINRSPYAYLANPESEREKYQGSVDKSLTLLKLRRDSDGKDVGVLTWFPVHGTSMLGNNTLITGDNKGVAAYLFEKYAEGLDSASDGLVAGFSQANVGDTSPNVRGAYCESGEDAGKQCDFKSSLCGGKNGPCHGRGPHWGLDDGGTASAFAIGRRQYLGARSIYESMVKKTSDEVEFESVRGTTVRSLHTFVDFANRTFVLSNGTLGRTCAAALGYSFAAGTTDGPGAFDFKQNNPGDPNANPFWAVVGNSLHSPGPDQIDCQGVKPILLDVGETMSPYQWSPNIVDIQLLRVGQLLIIVSPGEATTMAGRRWKDALASSAVGSWAEGSSESPFVVLGGPANSYTHYITTEEEYGVQRYEGASTLYGPNTLEAYINLTLSRLPYLSAAAQTSNDTSLPPFAASLPRLSPGPQPPINTNVSLSFIQPVVLDRAPLFKSFADVVDDVRPRYSLSSSSAPVISATFVGANPRNNLRLNGTFAAVEKHNQQLGIWQQVRSDADWSLVYEWKRTSSVAGTSTVRLSWELGWEVGVWGRNDSDDDDVDEGLIDALKGRYRFRYFGDAKSIGGTVTAFEGVSGEFELA
ncbi:hypothetical protein AAFC00_000799 [Neodothiora populina]|uniref:Neutral ceramidase n=1 Tax=Neodothiora populina TaxID=2781224 RepID=A0ABR3PLT2_9PEZI